MGIPVELWRARIGSFRCRGSTPKGHYAGVSDIAARLAAAYSCKHSKLVPDRGGGIAATYLLRVIVNGTRVLLRMVSRHILARLFKMADPDMKSLQLSSRTALLLCGSGTDLGAVMRVMLVTASLTVTRDAMIHLLALLQCNQARHYGAGYCSSSTEQQYSGGGGVVTLQCMIAAERLLAATLVYMMLILAGDIETNPGPTLSDRPKIHELTTLWKDDGTKLSVTYWITSHEQCRCVDFANLLLRDDVLVSRYQNDGMGIYEFVRTVLRDWLSRDDDSDQLNDAVPRTWAALAECVTNAGLAGALAKAIRDTCTLPSAMTTPPDHTHSPHLPDPASQGSAPAVPQSPLPSPSASSQQPSVSQPPLSVSQPPLSALLLPLSASQPPLSASLLPPPAAATLSGDQLSTMFHMMKEKGTFDLRILHLVLHGLPAVGKTCVKLKLTGQELTDQKPAEIASNGKLKYPDDNGARSTLVAEEILRARAPCTALGTEDKPWHLLNLDEEKFSVVRKISDSAEELTSSTAMAREQQAIELTPEPIADDDKGYQKLVHLFKNISKKPDPTVLQDIRKGTLIYLIDSGGQPQFQQFLPSLVSGPSLFLLTFSLAVGLHDEYEVRFTHSDGKREKYKTKTTIYNVLQQSLASIRCTCSYQSNGNEKVQVQPRVILVGTMKSLVNDDQIAAIDKDLMSLLQEFGADLIVPHGADKVVYPIDSFTSKGILELRQIIQDLASIPVSKFIDGKSYKSPMCEVKLPVPSVALELLLRSQDKSIISLEQCQEMARDFEISSVTELESVLWQLHHFTGSIRYYPDNDTLKQYVVTSPKILYDVPSILITRIFGFENRLVSCYDAKKMMQARGIFSMSTLEELWNEQDFNMTDSLLTPNLLIAFLLHLNIIAELDRTESGDRKFFMPSALVHCVSSSMKDDRVEDDSALVYFKGGYTPNGVFGSVLAYLLNKKELEHTQWTLDDTDSSIRYNQATLIVSMNSKYELLATLRVHIRFLEVKVKQESEDYPVASALMQEGCAVILSCIQHAVQTVVKDLHYTSCADLKEGLYFHCCRCPLDISIPHAAEFKEEGKGLCRGRSSKPDKFWETKWNKVASESQMRCHGAHKIDPSSYWSLRKYCKYKGEGTTLMVFDTGIDRNHPSFASKGDDKLWLPQEQSQEQFSCDDKSEHGHGTMCAGIACGDEVKLTDEDGKRFTCRGVAPGARLGIWKAYNKNEKGEWREQLEKLTEYMCSDEQKPFVDVLVICSGDTDYKIVPQKCFKKLKKVGIIVVCSGSNDGDTNLENIAYPACYPETICVGSHKQEGKPSDFSPVGKEMDFLAPGEDIIGPKSKDCKIIKSLSGISEESCKSFLRCRGTSYAAPALGGLICLILQAHRESSCPEVPLHDKCCFIKQVLISLTNQTGKSKVNNEIGYGAIAKDRLKKFFMDPKKFIEQMDRDDRD